jgi:hypothetical protein
VESLDVQLDTFAHVGGKDSFYDFCGAKLHSGGELSSKRNDNKNDKILTVSVT